MKDKLTFFASIVTILNFSCDSKQVHNMAANIYLIFIIFTNMFVILLELLSICFNLILHQYSFPTELGRIYVQLSFLMKILILTYQLELSIYNWRRYIRVMYKRMSNITNSSIWNGVAQIADIPLVFHHGFCCQFQTFRCSQDYSFFVYFSIKFVDILINCFHGIFFLCAYRSVHLNNLYGVSFR